MTVAIVFAVIVGLVLLGVAQLGYAYYMKREIQRPRTWPRCRRCRCWAWARRPIARGPSRPAGRRCWPTCPQS
ncbi:hypothetical protein WJ971_13950 [Achromobacter xylosoxidans]